AFFRSTRPMRSRDACPTTVRCSSWLSTASCETGSWRKSGSESSSAAAGCERGPLSRSRRQAGRSSSSCSKGLAPAPRLGTAGVTLEDYAFPTRIEMGTRQYARLVDEWVTAIGLRCEDYGTHSLRWTKAWIIYKATGNLRAVQLHPGGLRVK